VNEGNRGFKTKVTSELNRLRGDLEEETERKAERERDEERERRRREREKEAERKRERPSLGTELATVSSKRCHQPSRRAAQADATHRFAFVLLAPLKLGLTQRTSKEKQMG